MQWLLSLLGIAPGDGSDPETDKERAQRRERDLRQRLARLQYEAEVIQHDVPESAE